MSSALPIIFLALAVLCVVWGQKQAAAGFQEIVPLCCGGTGLCLVLAVVLLKPAAWRVELQADCAVCKGLLAKDTFTISYETCTIGMDWHMQNQNKIWWIYLCYGPKPTYPTENPANRMNTLKCKPGFIRIMYSDDLYQALMAVLPEAQRIALESSRKSEGFVKQGKIL